MQVRDILDKSTFLQLKKLMISAFMYIAVLVGPVGGLFIALRYVPVNLLPLRWYYKWVLSHVVRHSDHSLIPESVIEKRPRRSQSISS